MWPLLHRSSGHSRLGRAYIRDSIRLYSRPICSQPPPTDPGAPISQLRALANQYGDRAADIIQSAELRMTPVGSDAPDCLVSRETLQLGIQPVPLFLLFGAKRESGGMESCYRSIRNIVSIAGARGDASPSSRDVSRETSVNAAGEQRMRFCFSEGNTIHIRHQKPQIVRSPGSQTHLTHIKRFT